MSTTLPGTTIEISHFTHGCSRTLFDGIFTAGGVTLSQVSIMTGLEPYVIQNWIKRGFLTHSVKRLYSRQQFARVVLINMLRESLQIERICAITQTIDGITDDPGDDLIASDELYHRYIDMLAIDTIDPTSEASVQAAAEAAAEGICENDPHAKAMLCRILQVMYYAHTAAKLRNTAEQLLFSL
ncbi:MAG: DUF1836 domain-containing protein [Ruminococcaceae bacterium]|nr:DUF1836 domain-containing protein [Oscillospiraceae bacterium]